MINRCFPLGSGRTLARANSRMWIGRALMKACREGGRGRGRGGGRERERERERGRGRERGGESV